MAPSWVMQGSWKQRYLHAWWPLLEGSKIGGAMVAGTMGVLGYYYVAMDRY